jgi:hypothetical protein
LILKQCPDEVQRWGGRAILDDAVAIEAIVELLGKAKN